MIFKCDLRENAYFWWELAPISADYNQQNISPFSKSYIISFVQPSHTCLRILSPIHGMINVNPCLHYWDVKMGAIASQNTCLTIVHSTIDSGAYRREKKSASLAFVRGIHLWPVKFPHKWPVTRKIFPFDDIIMTRWDHYVIIGYLKAWKIGC